jgi:hypothetical protein
MYRAELKYPINDARLVEVLGSSLNTEFAFPNKLRLLKFLGILKSLETDVIIYERVLIKSKREIAIT